MGECLDIISGNGELLPSNISHKAATNNEYWFLHMINHYSLDDGGLNDGEYLSVDAKFRHGIHNAQECWNSLRLLSNLCFVNLQFQLMVLEVFLDLLPIHVVDILVCYRKDPTPPGVAFSELRIL